MSDKKVLNGIEYEKIDTTTFTINGEIYDNSFTKNDLSKLSKDGLIIVDIDTKKDTTKKDTTKKLKDLYVSENSFNSNLKQNEINKISNEDTNFRKYENYNNHILIGLGVLCLVIVSIIILL
jgi:hypothetical protein